MRNSKAKKIHKEVYGDDSTRGRRLTPMTKTITKHLKGKRVKEEFRDKTVRMTVGYMIADPKRQEYQRLKKEYNKLNTKERGMML